MKQHFFLKKLIRIEDTHKKIKRSLAIEESLKNESLDNQENRNPFELEPI